MKNLRRTKVLITTILFFVAVFFFNFAGGFIIYQSVYGYVKDASTKVGIYQAKVELKQNGVVVGSALTRSDGYYFISTSYKGNFDVYASKESYLSQKKTVYVDVGKSVKVDFYLERQQNPPDTTPPSVPIVQDSGAYTNFTTELSATWSSNDPESGISEYRYSINNSPEPLESLVWTSAGKNASVVATGLNLIRGETYYFLVKAKNGAGLWSGIGTSDGIKVNRLPVINSILPEFGKKFEETETALFSINASDPDLDVLQYQVTVNGVVWFPWSTASTFERKFTSEDVGLKEIKAEVRDGKGAITEGTTEIYVFRKPIQVN